MNLQRSSSSQKRRLKIGDIADILNVKKFIVRVWEKEFNLDRTGAGAYNDEDLALFKKIKELMAQKVSVSNAKKIVDEYYAQQAQFVQPQAVQPQVQAPAVQESELSIVNEVLLQQEVVLQDVCMQTESVVEHELSAEQHKEERFFAAVEEQPVVAAAMEVIVEKEIIQVHVPCIGQDCVSTQKLKNDIAQLKLMVLELQKMIM